MPSVSLSLHHYRSIAGCRLGTAAGGREAESRRETLHAAASRADLENPSGVHRAAPAERTRANVWRAGPAPRRGWDPQQPCLGVRRLRGEPAEGHGGDGPDACTGAHREGGGPPALRELGVHAWAADSTSTQELSPSPSSAPSPSLVVSGSVQS